MFPRAFRLPAHVVRAILLAASLALPAAPVQAQILYPRLGLPGCIHGDGIPYLTALGGFDTVTLDAVARYDEVILDASPICEYHPEILTELRARNPNIELLAYVTGENIWDVNNADSLVRYPTRYNHMIRDLDGFLYDTHGARWDPMSVNIAKRDANGRYVVAEAIAGLFNDVVIRTGLWDGMFVDVYGDYIMWTQAPGHTIDLARAGYASGAALDAAWRAGSDTLAARLRAFAGPDFILVGNTGVGTKYAWFNGWTREDFPFQEGGTWYTNMFWNPGGYFCDERNFRQPTHNTIFTPVDDQLPFSANNTRRVRFGLASAAMGTGFATAGPSDRGLLDPPHDQWWYDEYAVDIVSGQAMTDLAHTHWLGQALSDPYQMIWVGTNPDGCSNPGFETSVSAGWTFNRFGSAAATLDRDTTSAPVGRASAHVTITNPGVQRWDVNLTANGSLGMFPGNRYSMTFWARASSPRVLPVVATLSTGGEAASQNVTLDTTWKQYQVVLQPAQLYVASLEFFLGTQAGEVWFDDVHFQAGETSLWRRDFENGIVLVNPATGPLSVPLGTSYRRILGIRDPLVNDGATITTATVGPSDALFLIGPPLDHEPPGPIRDARIDP
jgi:hypothetical protein